jgi:hypothetical protein
MKFYLFMAILVMPWAQSQAQSQSNPCGIEGSVSERIKNCNFQKEGFILIARNDKGVEIYKDEKSGLIWGDRISNDFNHYGSQKACSNDIPEDKMLGDLKWRLPTIKEFEAAASRGMKTALPHMTHTFWTSSPVITRYRKGRRQRTISSPAYLWDGIEETTDTGDLKDAASVRCVAQEK